MELRGCQALRCLAKNSAPSRWLKTILTNLARREPADNLTGRERPGLSGPSISELVKAALTVLLVAVDPLMGCLAGYAEAFSELGDRVVVQLVVFEKSLSLFAHGNTSPGQGHSLL